MIRTATVTQVYPAGPTCDLVFESGLRMARVPIMSGALSSDGGFWGTPSAQKPATEETAGAPNSTGRNMSAIVGMYGRGAVVLGFFNPDGGVMSFTQNDRTIYRHPKSGAYWTIAPDGSQELFHPSGACIRIGTGGHEDLAGVTSGGFDVPVAAAPTITISHPHFSLTVDPSGNAVMTFTTLTLNGPVQINGNVSQTGSYAATGDGVFETKSVHNHTHDYNPGAGALTPTTPPI